MSSNYKYVDITKGKAKAGAKTLWSFWFQQALKVSKPEAVRGRA